jgi:hypothetical protein
VGCRRTQTVRSEGCKSIPNPQMENEQETETIIVLAIIAVVLEALGFAALMGLGTL